MNRRLVTLAATFLMLAMTASPLIARKKKIEEDTWIIQITPDASAAAWGEKAITDTLLLQQGFLKWKGGSERGYGTGPYSLKGTEITAQIKSAYEGTMAWTGNWTGNTIAGRMVLTRRDGSVVSYTFSGERASEVKKSKKKK